MKTRTISGDIRRIRTLMRLGPDIGSCVIRRKDYGELLKLFDSIEAKAKRMQEALNVLVTCDVAFRSGEEPWSVINDREIKTEAGPRIATAVNRECAIGIVECHNAIYDACEVLGFFEEEDSK